AEITALLVPLARLWKVARPGRVRLVSDSQYALNGFTRWLDSWAYRDWRTADGKPVANRRLWEQALFYTHRVRLSQEWVRGHQEAAPGRGPLHARAVVNHVVDGVAGLCRRRRIAHVCVEPGRDVVAEYRGLVGHRLRSEREDYLLALLGVLGPTSTEGSDAPSDDPGRGEQGSRGVRPGAAGPPSRLRHAGGRRPAAPDAAVPAQPRLLIPACDDAG